jgi:hypothetical protein
LQLPDHFEAANNNTAAIGDVAPLLAAWERIFELPRGVGAHEEPS